MDITAAATRAKTLTGHVEIPVVSMDQWTPAEIDAHMKYLDDFAARPESSGKFVDGQARAPEGSRRRLLSATTSRSRRPPCAEGIPTDFIDR